MKKNPYRIARAAVTMTFASFLLGACSGPKAPATQAIPSTELAAADTPKPDYPIELACAGISGTTVLAVTIGVHGKPTQVTLVQGSGNERLDKAAMDRVPAWKFKPASRNGQPVSQTIQVPVSFKPPAERPAECFALEARSPG